MVAFAASVHLIALCTFGPCPPIRQNMPASRPSRLLHLWGTNAIGMGPVAPLIIGPLEGGGRGPNRVPPPWKVPLCSWARAFCFVFVPNGGLVGAYSERAPDLLFLRVGGHGWASNARFWLPSKWPELQVWICPGESPRRPAINNEGGVCRLCSFQCTMHIGPVSPNSSKYAPISPTLPSPFVGRQYNW